MQPKTRGPSNGCAAQRPGTLWTRHKVWKLPATAPARHSVPARSFSSRSNKARAFRNGGLGSEASLNPDA